MKDITGKNIVIDGLFLRQRSKYMYLENAPFVPSGMFDLLVDIKNGTEFEVYRETWNNPNLTREEVALAIGESILTYIENNQSKSE